MKTSKFMQAYLNIIKESTEENEPTKSTPPEQTTEPASELKQVCFKTSDKDLIDAVNSGFEEAVFFVKAVDDDGKDTITEVKIKGDSFGEITVTEVPAEGETVTECGDGEGETVTECGDGEEEAITEDEEQACTECGKSPCECEQ
jgi:hypothetical protein